jgi:hypothetical protein
MPKLTTTLATRQLDSLKVALQLSDATYHLIYCDVESSLFAQGVLSLQLRSILCRGRVAMIAVDEAKKFLDVFAQLHRFLI